MANTGSGTVGLVRTRHVETCSSDRDLAVGEEGGDTEF